MCKNTITRSGILKFDPPDVTKKHHRQREWKRIAMITLKDDTCRYYQWFLERRFSLLQGKRGNSIWLNDPLRGPHVTIINDRTNDIKNWDILYDRYHNTEVSFTFNINTDIYSNGEHIYYKVNCPTGDLIRSEGGLGDPYYDFHLTIGRVSADIPHRREHINRIRKYLKDGY